jgi:hypothetical protein
MIMKIHVYSCFSNFSTWRHLFGIFLFKSHPNIRICEKLVEKKGSDNSQNFSSPRHPKIVSASPLGDASSLWEALKYILPWTLKESFPWTFWKATKRHTTFQDHSGTFIYPLQCPRDVRGTFRSILERLFAFRNVCEKLTLSVQGSTCGQKCLHIHLFYTLVIFYFLSS